MYVAVGGFNNSEIVYYSDFYYPFPQQTYTNSNSSAVQSILYNGGFIYIISNNILMAY